MLSLFQSFMMFFNLVFRLTSLFFGSIYSATQFIELFFISSVSNWFSFKLLLLLLVLMPSLLFSLFSEDFYFMYFNSCSVLIFIKIILVLSDKNQFCFLLHKLYDLSFFFYRTYAPQVAYLILFGVHVHCGLPCTLANTVYVGTDIQGLA